MAIWAAAIGGGLSLLGGIFGSKKSKQAAPAAPQGSTQPAFYDPYSQYRPAAANQLNALMQDPTLVQKSPEYAAMLEAAGRTSAAQGYNGSGNALVAAANAGGQAYQQEFNNLAMLSGANSSPSQAAWMAANQGNANQQQQNYQQQMQNQMWGNIGGAVGRTVYGYNNPGNGGVSNMPIPIDSSGIPGI